MFLIFLFSFFSLVHAEILMDEVLTVDRSEYSLKTVCSKILNNDFPLVEIASGTEVDCMGIKIDVAKFCDKELSADPYYIRAYTDKNKNKVICHTGKRVIFKYQCVKLTDKKICETHPRNACETFKEKLAKRLDLVHFSKMKNAKGHEQVNCYFEAESQVDKKSVL